MSRASELAERLEATYDHNNTNEAAAELRRLDRVNAELVEAAKGVLAWDARRKFPVPYEVRDPLCAALTSATKETK